LDDHTDPVATAPLATYLAWLERQPLAANSRRTYRARVTQYRASWRPPGSGWDELANLYFSSIWYPEGTFCLVKWNRRNPYEGHSCGAADPCPRLTFRTP
jgi:hypothetical protein